jgi:hypothetical protein
LPAVAQPNLYEQTPAKDRLLGRQAPAWLLSLALHLASVLVGVLLVRGTQLPRSAQEPLRQSSIVLARLTSKSPPEYLSEDDFIQAATAARTAAAADNVNTVEPPDAPPPPAVELPRAAGPAANADVLVIRPQPKASRGAPRPGLSAEDVAAILAEEAARARPAAPAGPRSRLSLFGSADAEGNSFVFLIDRSDSMGHQGLGAISAAAKELAASIDRLGPDQKFQVIAYNQTPFFLAGRELIPATDENRKRLVEFVANLSAFGATEHEMGLYAALRLKPDVIFLLTDGGEPELNAGQLRAIREAAAGRTAIHCLHFGKGSAAEEESFLELLAAQTGGSYVYIDINTK